MSGKPAFFAAGYSRLVKKGERVKRVALLMPQTIDRITKTKNFEARDHVLSAVAVRTGVPPREVLGRSRVHSVVYARSLTAAALRALGFSLACIGSALDRDHTSIMHQIGQIYAQARFQEQAGHDLVWAIHAADELGEQRKEASA